MSLPVNEENWTKWLDVLATTDLPQARNLLASRLPNLGPDVVGYCCLGIGCVTSKVRFQERASLAPIEFIDWLGIDVDGDDDDEDSGWDLVIDWPHGLTDRGSDAERASVPPRPYSAYIDSAAALNDGGFTFAQIADILRYFGISQARP